MNYWVRAKIQDENRRFQKSRLKKGFGHLLAKVPETLNVGANRFHGMQCGWCINYKECKKFKNIAPKMNYCHYPQHVKKFELKKAK